MYEFEDPESGIQEYRTVIYETKFGLKQKFWPPNDHYNISKPSSPYNGKVKTTVENLLMNDGALYTLHVTALNGALLASSHETNGITIDTSPPQAPKVNDLLQIFTY